MRRGWHAGPPGDPTTCAASNHQRPSAAAAGRRSTGACLGDPLPMACRDRCRAPVGRRPPQGAESQDRLSPSTVVERRRPATVLQFEDARAHPHLGQRFQLSRADATTTGSPDPVRAVARSAPISAHSSANVASPASHRAGAVAVDGAHGLSLRYAHGHGMLVEALASPPGMRKATQRSGGRRLAGRRSDRSGSQLV
jgi:hypothetical protein